jgi:histidinol-phosphate/aromatic aminotransferase/cobyric acid decarboxylase-like protein
MKRNIDARIVHNDGTKVDNWGHIDHGFYMIDDNTIICVNQNWVPVALREKNIIVRHFKKERIDQYLRITVGTDDDCSKLLDACKLILS